MLEIVQKIANGELTFLYLITSEKGGMKTRLDSGKFAFAKETVPEGYYVVGVQEEKERYAFLNIVASAEELKNWWSNKSEEYSNIERAFYARYFRYFEAVKKRIEKLMPTEYKDGYYICHCGGKLYREWWGYQCEKCQEKYTYSVEEYEHEYKSDDEDTRIWKEVVITWKPSKPDYIPPEWNESYDALYKRDFYIEFPRIYIPRFSRDFLWAENVIRVSKKIQELEEIVIPEPESVENLSVGELLSLFK